ncbi:MAG: hypothetical protein HRU19_07030 [Pseudobacteriovorax sp.]|nr:hypothetical protein [Pseudobacteriovorax sp.]
MRNIFLSLSLVLLASSALAKPIDTKPYSKKLKETLTQIEMKKSLKDISKQSGELVSMSKPILTAFKKVQPECSAYIDTVLKVADTMTSMPLDKIESDYHADKALPKAPSICHHAKDMLVHPATVVALEKANAKNKDAKVYQKMLAELVELASHVQVVEVKLASK